MNTLTPLHALFAHDRTGERHVWHDGNRFIKFIELESQVGKYTAILKGRSEVRWLLINDDPGNFCIYLLALLQAGKEVVLPPNAQHGTLSQLSGSFDAVMNEDIQSMHPVFESLAQIDPTTAIIELYTSGSTGLPKQVRKTLTQFETEIAILESLWGDELNQATIVSTVPHHHIYGLLFRLFWPLSAGRTFDTVTCTYPDMLNERLAVLKDTALVSSPAQLSRLPALLPLNSLSNTPRMIFSSGGPLSNAIADEFRNALGAAPTEIFGSTETGGVAWRRQNNDDAWTPFPGIRLSWASGSAPKMRSPYLAPDMDWFMDDGIELLPDGRFLLGGRLDRVVKIEEKRLSLPDMEAQLVSHPWIETAAATALNGRRQTIGAVIVLNADGVQQMNDGGRRNTIRDLRSYLANVFETVLLPRQWRFVEHLPLNERGKLSAAAIASFFQPSKDASGLWPVVLSVHRNEGAHAEVSSEVSLDLHVPTELAHFAGHFPEHPILPGVVQIDWAVRYARQYLNVIGNFSAIENIKFQSIVLPAANIKLALRWDGEKSRLDFSFAATQNAQSTHSSGRIIFSGAQ